MHYAHITRIPNNSMLNQLKSAPTVYTIVYRTVYRTHTIIPQPQYNP